MLPERSGKDYVSNSDEIEALDSADRPSVSWANRASHSFDVVGRESAKLIDNCERALESNCSSQGGKWTCPDLMDTPKSAKVSAEGVNGGEGRKA
jgi:hypothetical protein